MEIRREPVFEAEPRKGAPTLAEFAIKSQISEDKVWELIEEGQVSARFVNEAILIMQDQPVVESVPSSPRPNPEPGLSEEGAILPEISASPTPEKEVLPDDFTETNTDILVFAQEALSRNAELSKELLATKDELIRLKDEKIAFLVDRLAEKDKELRSLNRKLEELATLRKFDIG